MASQEAVGLYFKVPGTSAGGVEKLSLSELGVPGMREELVETSEWNSSSKVQSEDERQKLQAAAT
jgi:hypothetical protein